MRYRRSVSDPEPPELRETEARLRAAMGEAADGFDLDEHARQIAVEVTRAREALVEAPDALAARTAERMEEERWRRRSQKHTGS